MKKKQIFLLGIFLLLFFGCTSDIKQVKISPQTASDMVPPSSSYDVTDVTDEGNAAIVIAVEVGLKSQPETTAFAEIGSSRVGVFLNCLKENGATEVAWYSSKTDVLSQGVYAVAEENNTKIYNCVWKSLTTVASLTDDRYGFCGSRLTIQTENSKRYHVVFIGTSEKVCDEMCNIEVNGCTNLDLTTYYLE